MRTLSLACTHILTRRPHLIVVLTILTRRPHLIVIILFISAWIVAGLMTQVQQVLNSLSGEVLGRIAQMEKAMPTPEQAFDTDFIRKHFMSLLCELNSTAKLPAVIFCFDRDMCEQLVIETVETLERWERTEMEAAADTP
jgi:hypothetical protein